MSHFTAYVLVSGSTCRVIERVGHLMAPYDNDFEVEEYETECDCNWQREGYDPHCEVCGGTGRYITTRNPMPKFEDYFVVDIDHVLRDAEKDSSQLTEKAAIAPLASLDVDKLKLPRVIVTPSGEWHEMDGDWWSEDQDSADWKQLKNTVKEIYQKYPSAILVVLNCHS
jgi:hypothetical protein